MASMAQVLWPDENGIIPKSYGSYTLIWGVLFEKLSLYMTDITKYSIYIRIVMRNNLI